MIMVCSEKGYEKFWAFGENVKYEYYAPPKLKNRYLRVGCEYGSKAANAISGLHRHTDRAKQPNVGINVGINSADIGINVGIKYNDVLSHTEESAVKAIMRDNRITAKSLSVVLGVTLRQAERIMASLKKKANLRRVGSRKNGHWVFGD